MAGLVAGNDAALEKGQPHGLADDQSDFARSASFTENTRSGRKLHPHVSAGEKISIIQAVFEAIYRMGEPSSDVWYRHTWMLRTIEYCWSLVHLESGR
jgi:hypothetical protein